MEAAIRTARQSTSADVFAGLAATIEASFSINEPRLPGWPVVHFDADAEDLLDESGP
jgi:hypothetical protein